MSTTNSAGHDAGTDKHPGLCDDEGCDHHGIDHVCNPPKALTFTIDAEGSGGIRTLRFLDGGGVRPAWPSEIELWEALDAVRKTNEHAARLIINNDRAEAVKWAKGLMLTVDEGLAVMATAAQQAGAPLPLKATESMIDAALEEVGEQNLPALVWDAMVSAWQKQAGAPLPLATGNEAEMRAVLQELHDKFNTRVYGTGSYIKRDMRDRIAAVLNATHAQPQADAAEPVAVNAARYVYLRENCTDLHVKSDGKFQLPDYAAVSFGWKRREWVDGKPVVTMPTLDAAVDAAIAAQAPGARGQA